MWRPRATSAELDVLILMALCCVFVGRCVWLWTICTLRWHGGPACGGAWRACNRRCGGPGIRPPPSHSHGRDDQRWTYAPDPARSMLDTRRSTLREQARSNTPVVIRFCVERFKKNLFGYIISKPGSAGTV
jgi:hypothetical protein